VVGRRLLPTVGLAVSYAVHMIRVYPLPIYLNVHLLPCQTAQISTMDLTNQCDSEGAILAIKKRADATRRQHKCRSSRQQPSVNGSSVLESIPASTAVRLPFSFSFLSNQCCSACGCHHATDVTCPCVRCHARHAEGSDCFDDSTLASMPAYHRNCSACGCLHNSVSRCPCVRCQALHPIGSVCIDSVPASVGLKRVRSDRSCSVCGCLHISGTPCPCVLCHAMHADGSDCLDKVSSQLSDYIPSSYAANPDLCLACGGLHPVIVDCPCVICQTHHDGDCPTSFIAERGVCPLCAIRHFDVLWTTLCPCVRCHHRHPGADCPVSNPMPAILRSPRVSRRVREIALTSDVDIVPFHTCGPMSVVCPHCRARTFQHERLNCCSDGQVIVADRNEVPQEFRDLILSAHVRSNFRIYNSVMALASIGHSNKSLAGGTFVLGGHAYHRIGSMLPGNVLIATDISYFLSQWFQLTLLNVRRKQRAQICPNLRVGY